MQQDNRGGFAGGYKQHFSQFVLERMENKKYVFFSKNHKIRTLTAMGLIFCLKVPYLLVDS